MTQSYSLLIHVSFEEQSKKVIAKNQKIEGALVAAIQEVLADPLPGTMRDIGNPHLRGIVHKKHVGGRKGHRLIYLFFAGSKIIVPVFISPTPKPPFDYDQVNWEAICESLYEDYTHKNYAAFKNWKKPSNN